MGNMIGNDIKEVCIRQYLLIRFSGLKFNKRLLFHKANEDDQIGYSVPPEWRFILMENGFKVSKWRSAVLWNSNLLLLLFYGIYQAIIVIYRSLMGLRNNDQTVRPYVFFCNLGPRNLPSENKEKVSYDVISWYIKNAHNESKFDVIKHDVCRVTSTFINGKVIEPSPAGPVPHLDSIKNICSFSLWFLLAALVCFIDLLRGRWWHALIFSEAIISKKASLINPKYFAEEYYFHQSNPTYRPLWTYVAEKCGSSISLYFYSINMESINLDPSYHFRCMTWSRYLVWDQYTENFIRRCIKEEQKPEIEIVDPIWFNNSGDIKLPEKENNIIIFDVVPHRPLSSSLHLDENLYVTVENCNKFIVDVVNIAGRKNLTCWYKGKRDLGISKINKRYKTTVDTLSKKSEFVTLSHEIAPHEIIPLCSVVICFPFSAPAVIARELGIPSCYYDPTGMIDEHHPAAHGIKIIGNKIRLQNWVKAKMRC